MGTFHMCKTQHLETESPGDSAQCQSLYDALPSDQSKHLQHCPPPTRAPHQSDTASQNKLCVNMNQRASDNASTSLKYRRTRNDGMTAHQLQSEIHCTTLNLLDRNFTRHIRMAYLYVSAGRRKRSIRSASQSAANPRKIRERAEHKIRSGTFALMQTWKKHQQQQTPKRVPPA